MVVLLLQSVNHNDYLNSAITLESITDIIDCVANQPQISADFAILVLISTVIASDYLSTINGERIIIIKVL